jgi:hypothetical protein
MGRAGVDDGGGRARVCLLCLLVGALSFCVVATQVVRRMHGRLARSSTDRQLCRSQAGSSTDRQFCKITGTVDGQTILLNHWHGRRRTDNSATSQAGSSMDRQFVEVKSNCVCQTSTSFDGSSGKRPRDLIIFLIWRSKRS